MTYDVLHTARQGHESIYRTSKLYNTSYNTTIQSNTDNRRTRIYMKLMIGSLLSLNPFSPFVALHAPPPRAPSRQAILSEMPKVGVRPNVVSCNAAIKACGEAGQWQHALAILRGMPNAGLLPDAISYNSAIAALGIAGQNEQASFDCCTAACIVFCLFPSHEYTGTYEYYLYTASSMYDGIIYDYRRKQHSSKDETTCTPAI